MKHWSDTHRLSPVTSLVKIVIAALIVSACGAQKGERGLLRDLFSDELPSLQARSGDAGRGTDGPSNGDSNDDSDEPPLDDESNDDDPRPTPSDPDDDAPDPVDSCGNTAAETAEVGRRCEVGVGGCLRTGWVRCIDDEPTCDVEPGEPVEETCNGRDDDCDGEVDEDIDGSACTAGVGSCERTGTATCSDGRFSCDAIAAEQSSEICNGLDDDCNGRVDDIYYFNEQCSVGVGECERIGRPACIDGALGCDATPGTPSDELCNGVDDDCDGEIDEGFDIGSACNVGVGECQRPGVLRCLGDTVTGCTAQEGERSAELCNGLDDDCDGNVDDGNVCPDSTVQNTLPFDGGVWYTTSASSCGRERIVQFWPTLDETNVYSGFPCYSRWWTFRATDGELFVNDHDTIIRHVQGGSDELLDTPDCYVTPPFGFDEENQLYYRCNDRTVRRGGQTLITDTDTLLGVRSDGGSLVMLDDELQLFDASGAMLVAYNPHSEYDGSLTFVGTRAVIHDNNFFALYIRGFNSDRELLLLRISASNSVLLVRRVPLVAEPSFNMRATPDGSIFEFLPNEDATAYMIRRYAPDNSEEVVWRESEANPLDFGSEELLVGPRL